MVRAYDSPLNPSLSSSLSRSLFFCIILSRSYGVSAKFASDVSNLFHCFECPRSSRNRHSSSIQVSNLGRPHLAKARASSMVDRHEHANDMDIDASGVNALQASSTDHGRDVEISKDRKRHSEAEPTGPTDACATHFAEIDDRSSHLPSHSPQEADRQARTVSPETHKPYSAFSRRMKWFIASMVGLAGICKSMVSTLHRARVSGHCFPLSLHHYAKLMGEWKH